VQKGIFIQIQAKYLRKSKNISQNIEPALKKIELSVQKKTSGCN
jgi:hypothetical protein